MKRVVTIQDRHFALLTRDGSALIDMLDAIKAAKAANATEAQLAPMLEMQRKAQWARGTDGRPFPGRFRRWTASCVLATIGGTQHDMQCKEIMRPNIQWTTPRGNVAGAAKLMALHNLRLL
jgi:hypothetical protein